MRCFTVLSLALLSLSVFGQKTLYDHGVLEDDKFYKNTFLSSEMATDFARAVKKGEITKDKIKLKRLGLLTFHVFEANFKKQKAHFTFKHAPEGSSSVIQKIYDESISALTDSLKNHGIELIMPADFPDQDLLSKAQTKINELANKSNGFPETLNEHNLSNTPDNLAYVGSHVEQGSNQEILNEIGVLAKRQKLDGFLAIQITTQHFNYALAFRSVDLQIYIPHPAPGKKKQFGYKAGDYFYMPKEPVGFVGIKKDEVIGEDYRGFPPIISRSVGDFANFMTMEIETLFE